MEVFKEVFKPLIENARGGWGCSRRDSQPQGEVVGETHRGLECAQAHPLGNQHQRGPVSLWVAQLVTTIRWTVEQAPLLPLGPYTRYSITAQ